MANDRDSRRDSHEGAGNYVIDSSQGVAKPQFVSQSVSDRAAPVTQGDLLDWGYCSNSHRPGTYYPSHESGC